jgi:16S rRNA (guanine527-N7)-methyltransferase
MQPARIAELLQPFLANDCHSEPAPSGGEEPAVSLRQLEHISTYIDILLRWNPRINLTAVREPEQIVTRHFGESLFAARCLFPATDKRRTTHNRVADLGSGAGFPGLPMKILAPEIHLTLIESNHKKTTFLREVVRALDLTRVDVQNARAESVTQTFGLVTVRAVERFAHTLPVAAALVAPGGRLALLMGASQLESAQSTLPQISWDPPVQIPQSRSRILYVGRAQ